MVSHLRFPPGLVGGLLLAYLRICDLLDIPLDSYVLNE